MKQKNALHTGTGFSGKVSYAFDNQVCVHSTPQIRRHDETWCTQYEQVKTKITSALMNAAQVASKLDKFTVQPWWHPED